MGTDGKHTTCQQCTAYPLVCAVQAFSGIGAFEQAIKNLHINHTNAFMIDIDTYVVKTYMANHAVNNVYTDITTIEPETLPNMDLFVFGSPCQSFSTQGNKEAWKTLVGLSYTMDLISLRPNNQNILFLRMLKALLTTIVEKPLRLSKQLLKSSIIPYNILY